MNFVQDGGGYAVWIWYTITAEDTHHQYGGGYAVWTCYTICMVEGVQCRSVTSSVETKVCSTALPKLFRGLLVIVYFFGENDIL